MPANEHQGQSNYSAVGWWWWWWWWWGEAANPPAPPFPFHTHRIYTPAHTPPLLCLSVSCSRNVLDVFEQRRGRIYTPAMNTKRRRMKYASGNLEIQRFVSELDSLGGVDGLRVSSLKRELMRRTQTCTHVFSPISPPPPAPTLPRCNGDAGLVAECLLRKGGREGGRWEGGDLCETACWLARCVCVCVFCSSVLCRLRSPARKHQSSLSVWCWPPRLLFALFFFCPLILLSFLSLSAGAAALPPSTPCPLCRQ